MRFGFIAARPQKSFDHLRECAALRGHQVEHIPLDDLTLSWDSLTGFAKRCGSAYDALHYYGGVADPVGVIFGQICDELGIPLLNNRAHIHPLVHNKMFQSLSFSRAGLPIPKTEFTRSPNWEKLTARLGDPVVAKRVRGTQGKHVHIINDQSQLNSIEGASEYLFQEYLPHSNDIRVLVLAGKAACGYRRVPVDGDFRANLALGGHAESLSDQDEADTVFSLAEAAVSAVPHDLAGVDIIRSDKDGTYRLIEINTNPSWYGILETTNVNFPDMLLDKYEQLAASRP